MKSSKKSDRGTAKANPRKQDFLSVSSQTGRSIARQMAADDIASYAAALGEKEGLKRSASIEEMVDRRNTLVEKFKTIYGAANVPPTASQLDYAAKLCLKHRVSMPTEMTKAGVSKFIKETQELHSPASAAQRSLIEKINRECGNVRQFVPLNLDDALTADLAHRFIGHWVHLLTAKNIEAMKAQELATLSAMPVPMQFGRLTQYAAEQYIAFWIGITDSPNFTATMKKLPSFISDPDQSNAATAQMQGLRDGLSLMEDAITPFEFIADKKPKRVTKRTIAEDEARRLAEMIKGPGFGRITERQVQPNEDTKVFTLEDRPHWEAQRQSAIDANRIRNDRWLESDRDAGHRFDSNAVKRADLALAILDLGANFYEVSDGLLVGKKIIVGVSKRVFRIPGTSKWNPYRNLTKLLKTFGIEGVAQQ